MLEHTRSTKNYKTNTTALAQRAHNFKHNLDFKEVKILEQEQNFKKRLYEIIFQDAITNFVFWQSLQFCINKYYLQKTKHLLHISSSFLDYIALFELHNSFHCIF